MARILSADGAVSEGEGFVDLDEFRGGKGADVFDEVIGSER